LAQEIASEEKTALFFKINSQSIEILLKDFKFLGGIYIE